MIRMLEATCENILSTDPDALIPTKDSSALAPVSFGHDTCTSYKGTGRATKHASHERVDTRTRPPDWRQFTDQNKRPPGRMKKPASGIR